MRTCAFAIMLLAAGLAGAPALAADICSERSHQFGKMRHCVTSVRPAQGSTTFGPESLAGTGDGAWCAGSESAGGTQTMTLHEEPNALIRAIDITNGFAKSEETFRQNSRVKRLLIETDRGYRGNVTLKDTRASQRIIVAVGTLTPAGTAKPLGP